VSHRGSEGEGYYYDERNGFAAGACYSARSSKSLQAQPLVSSNGRYIVVFDGALSNSSYWVTELESKGVIFKDRNSDVEVLLHLYESFGKDVLKCLNGMFAFIIYDKGEQTVFGARDHAGIKPFYYSLADSGFSFASELKALFKIPGLAKSLSWQSVWDYFSLQFVPPDKAIYKDVYKLPAGHGFFYKVDTQKLVIKPYWKPSFDNLERKTPREYKQQVYSGVEDAVKRWATKQNGTVGCLLTSSVPSAAIVAMLSKGEGYRVKTWSIGTVDAEDSESRELNLCRIVAEKYKTEHQEIKIRPEDFKLGLDKLVEAFDEPYAGDVMPWFAFQSMADSEGTVLTEVGADELFGNYGRWLMYQPRRPSHLGGILKHIAGTGLAQFVKNPKGALLYDGLGEAQKERVMQLSATLMTSTPSLLSSLWKDAPVHDERNVVPFIDFQTQLPQKSLYMLDSLSAYHSIEARTPFLDKDFIRDTFSIPPAVRCSATSKLHKRLFRETFADELPKEIIMNQEVEGGAYLERALRVDLKEELMEYANPRFLEHQGIFLPIFYDKYVAPHLAKKKNYTSVLWSFFMFQKWWFKNLGGR
jgi:asparagine synthase (glutamine-hydrolysing)